jgi:endonuclease/exonuclease/phosphatase family metal-dependent hydrolase
VVLIAAVLQGAAVMSRLIGWIVPAGILVVGMALACHPDGASVAVAAASEVKDEAGLFSEEAVTRANQQIRDLASKYDRDVRVETFAGVPADQADKFQDLSKSERARFFRTWAEDRSKAEKVNGIYILVCKDPGHVEIVISREARATFDQQAVRKLRDLLVKKFGDKQFDDGLLAAVQLVQEQWAAAASPETEAGAPAAEGGYLFCSWNVENLFDDRRDGRESKADEEYDTWFARDPEALRLKLDHLSEALCRLNGGRGPDILAVVEVENRRAATLLQEALNRRLANPRLAYTHLLMKDLAAGRHIAPAILTRLPVVEDRTRLHGSRLRILEGHIKVNGHDLTVLATHWTSRVSDQDGSRRAKYADQIYGVFRAMYTSNPKVDLLICGDFNDPPDAPSVVDHLHATDNVEAVLHPQGLPKLLDLFAGKDPAAGFGTHYYGNRWYIFDQIVVSPGMLDREGWACDPKSARTVNTLYKEGDPRKRPWRFGNERDRGPRGYSDHFPVTVRLKVY